MNNKQFRSLLANEPKPDQTTNPSSTSTRAVLGGRRHAHSSSTSPSGASFAQSVRDRSAFLKKPEKQFKSTVPKGSKIASGYVDRARIRAQEGGESMNNNDDKAERIRALEEQLKKREISPNAFEAARDSITAGDISSTHLVKGLDRQLLERVRQGENVMGANIPRSAEDDEMDDELDKIEASHTQRIEKPSASTKQGQMASNLAAGRKRTRDEIMAELRARRKEQNTEDIKAKPEPALDDRWRRVNEHQRSRIEVDRKGREVLVIFDEHDIVQKKLRKPAGAKERKVEQVIGRNVPGEVLGADIKLPTQSTAQQDIQQGTEQQQHDEDVDDDDIFEGVGTDYDPLGGDVTESEDDASHESHENHTHKEDRRTKGQQSGDKDRLDSADAPATAIENINFTRNYFQDKRNETEQQPQHHLRGVEAMIAKAARLASEQEQRPTETDEDKAAALRRAKHAAMLNTRDRDMDDLDLGFGGSRFEDGEDDEDAGKRLRLSEWSGTEKREDKEKRRKDRKRS